MEKPGEETKIEIRKVLKFGGSLVFTIPKDFVDKLNLKEGDQLKIFVWRNILTAIPVNPAEIEKEMRRIQEEVREADVYEQEQREEILKSIPPPTKEELERIRKIKERLKKVK